MPLFDEIEQEVRASTRCSLGQLLDEMDEEDRAGLLRALAADRKRFPNAAIKRALDRRRIVIDKMTISGHRQGSCRCRV